MNKLRANDLWTALLPLLATALLLPSCEKSNSAAFTQQAPTPSESPVSATAASASPETPAETPVAQENESAIAERLAVAGIDNPQAAKDFIAQMKTAATNEDADAIANLIHYPFTTYNLGEPVKTYTTPAELLADFEQVVTPAVIAAMSQANYDDLFANDQGIMIGDGEVWIGQFETGIQIRAINPI